MGDCNNFLTSNENWAERAAKLGWDAPALFGCRRNRPLDYLGDAGLLWFINGGLPGAELSFAGEVRCLPRTFVWRERIINHKTAIFRQVNQEHKGCLPRRAGVSGRPDRPADVSERRSGGHGPSVTGDRREG